MKLIKKKYELVCVYCGKSLKNTPDYIKEENLNFCDKICKFHYKKQVKDYEIVTPAEVIHYCSFSKRTIAAVVDIFILCFGCLIFGGAYTLLFGMMFGIVLSEYEFASIFCTVTCWLYYSLTESSFLQGTPGKKLLGIIVTDINLKRISFWRASLRFILKILTVLSLFFGYLMILFNIKNQALHDKLSSCLVIEKENKSI